MRRIFLGLTAFVALVALFLAGQHEGAPPVGPQVPPETPACPPPTTITLPPATTTAGAVHAARLRRGPACPGVVVLGT